MVRLGTMVRLDMGMVLNTMVLNTIMRLEAVDHRVEH